MNKTKLERCVVVQGPTNSENITKIKDSWKGYDIIFSTWENSDRSLYSDDDIVVYSKFPEINGFLNYNLQRISTYSGLLKAKELGYKRALKWRCDFIPLNTDKFVSLFKEDKLYFYCWHFQFGGSTLDFFCGYLTDFFCEGSIDYLLKIFEDSEYYMNPKDNTPPEVIFTKKVRDHNLINDVNLLCDYITKENDILWIKNNIYMSEHRDLPQYFNKIPKNFIAEMKKNMLDDSYNLHVKLF